MIVFMPPPVRSLPPLGPGATPEAYQRRKEYLDRQIDMCNQFLAAVLAALLGVLLTMIVTVVEYEILTMTIGTEATRNLNVWLVLVVVECQLIAVFFALYSLFRRLVDDSADDLNQSHP